MSEEDLKDQFLTWTRERSRVSPSRMPASSSTDLLFGAHEAGDLPRLHLYQVTLPISTSTTHTWLIKLGCASTNGPPSRTALTPKRWGRYSSSSAPRRGKVPRKETPARQGQAVQVRVRRDSRKPEEVARLDAT
ncbi:unnamed protein product [Ectocarpus fasciculatus]